MTLNSYLPDGSRSLVLINDSNFNREQANQLLLFRLFTNRAITSMKQSILFVGTMLLNSN